MCNVNGMNATELNFNQETLNTGVCFAVTDSEIQGSPERRCIVSDEQAGGGGCEPLGGQVSNEAWEKHISVCQAKTGEGGCSDGQMCVPREVAINTTDVTCIHQAGNHDCPPEWPDKLRAFDESVANDNRDCTDCECDLACTETKYTIYDDNVCTEDPMVVSSECETVKDLLDNGTGSVKLTTLPQASCTHSGGDPIGAVDTGTDKGVTFCCKATPEASSM
jgi:hypothetical protein